MDYEKGKTYLVIHPEPLEIKTKTDDSALTVTLISPGRGVFCKSYSVDTNHDTWIRTNVGWVRATNGNTVLIQ